MKRLIALAAAGISAVAFACSGEDGSGQAQRTPVIDPRDGGVYESGIAPADFADRIDNPYLPLFPGSRWVYESEDGDERIEVVVLDETRDVMGITATVVRDTVTEDGEIVEDTLDWYAQDRDGNVWYMGEASTEFQDGKPASTAGSWEAGFDSAQPGIIMRARPRVGDAYRQEYFAGEAEDMAEVVKLGAAVTVPYGSFDGLVVIREWTPLEPEVIEHKFYARGVGVVLEETVRGGEGRVELVSFEPGK